MEKPVLYRNNTDNAVLDGKLKKKAIEVTMNEFINLIKKNPLDADSFYQVMNLYEQKINKSQVPFGVSLFHGKLNNFIAIRIFWTVVAQLKKFNAKGSQDRFDFTYTIGNEFYVRIPVKILNEHHYDKLQPAIDEIMSLKRYKEDEVKHLNYAIFPYIDYKPGDGSMNVQIHSLAIKDLCDLANGYYKFNIRDFLKLNDVYSQLWYVILCENCYKNKTLRVTAPWLRENILKGNMEMYKRNNDLFKRTFESPIEKINKLTNLFSSYTTIDNQQKPILGYMVSTKSKDTRDIVDIESEEVSAIKELMDKMNRTNIDQKQFLLYLKVKYNISKKNYELMEKYPQIREAVADFERKVINGKAPKIKKTTESYVNGMIKKMGGIYSLPLE